MPKTSHRGVLLALAFAFLVGLAIGCGKKDEPQPTPAPNPGGSPNINPNPPGPFGGPSTATANEDPEALAYYQKKGWNLTSTSVLEGKEQVWLPIRGELNADDYKMIARSKTVQVLNVGDVKVTDDGAKAIAGIPQLESLMISCENLTDAGLKSLAGCKSLEFLQLVRGYELTDAGLKELASLPKLRVLHVMAEKLDGSGFAPFAGSKTLTTIGLNGLENFGDEGAKHLAKLPNLTELTIDSRSGRKMTAAGITAIAKVRVPDVFKFPSELLDDDLLALLVSKNWYPAEYSFREKRPTKPEAVRTIVIGDSKVTDKGFATLLKCTNAEYLGLDNSGITDETLKKLSGFTQLKNLSVGKTKVTAAGLETVAGMPIKRIRLAECQLTEEMFKALGKMSTLEELNLFEAKFKPEWLKHIAALPNLTELEVAFTDVGDTEFQELLKLPKLRILSVSRTKISKEVYQKAKKDHPKLALSYSGYDN